MTTMIIKISIIIFLFFGLAWSSFAQNIEFEKANFPGKESEFKEAMKSYKEGLKLFEANPPLYNDAVIHLVRANTFNPNNALLNFMIGKSFYSLKNFDKAKNYLEKAKTLKQNVSPDINYLLGKIYHYSYDFDKAIALFTEFKQGLDPKMISTYEEIIKKEIDECKNGKILIEKPTRVIINNLGKTVNSRFAEYSPVVNADRSVIFFTSRRESTTGGLLDESIGQYFEDIYYSKKLNDGSWESPVNPGMPLNSPAHDAIVGLSPDGQQLYIYKDEGGGDIFMSKLNGTIWDKPTRLSKEINSDYHESSASFSFDYLTIYFVSDKPGGYGGHDIYKSTKDASGKWTDPVNLGGDINTPYEEASIFALPDGKTFYFSSKGHNTMGGYDIFRITYENGKWSEPENLGYPVNTTSDDVFFSISASGKFGYYATKKEGGQGNLDLYEIIFLGEEKSVVDNNEDNLLAFRTEGIQERVIESAEKIEKINMTLLKGTITDKFTKEPLMAKIELVDLEKNQVIATLESNKASGKYLVTLPAGKNYGITVKAENCLFYSENVDLTTATGYNETVKDIELMKIEVGSKVVLKNIFFDSGKSTLRPESEPELANLLKFMTEIPTLKIEISGHTDNVGSAAVNKKLSEARAKAVVDYMIAKGVATDRMTYKGYGFDQPVATNDTAEGKQQNRRTEFKVLSR